MMHDGQRYVRSRAVVPLPKELWEGEHKNYATFGRIVKQGTKGAVQTTYRYRGYLPSRLWTGEKCQPPDGEDEGKPFWYVWAKPIPSDGHSLTYLMYGKDGGAYLLHNGGVYVRGKKATR